VDEESGWREGALTELAPYGTNRDDPYPIIGRHDSMTLFQMVYYECDENYGDAQSGGCVPADRDYDCSELRSWGIASIPVQGEDWMLLDDDGDGWGCEPIVVEQAAPVAVPTAESADPCEGVLGMLGCLLG
jgi:hypothetical protein